MSVAACGALAVVAGSTLARPARAVDGRMRAVVDALAAAAVVMVAVRVAGIYGGGAAAIGHVAGRWWPVPLVRPESAHGEPWPAWGALFALLPVETATAAAVAFALRRRWSAATAALAVVPIVAVLRHQPLPHRVASIAIALVLWLRRRELRRRVSSLAG